MGNLQGDSTKDFEEILFRHSKKERMKLDFHLINSTPFLAACGGSGGESCGVSYR
jgi:hypothetical protein